MTEAQQQMRRALQEAMDRRDNGGAPHVVGGRDATRADETGPTESSSRRSG